MWYIPLNTEIEVGTTRRPQTEVVRVARETEKAVMFSIEHSRHGEMTPIWLPKSKILKLGEKALVLDEC